MEFWGLINTVKKHTLEIIGQYLKNTTRFGNVVSSHSSLMPFKIVKMESTRKSSNIYLRWTKIEYQNNLNPIALFSTLNKR